MFATYISIAELDVVINLHCQLCPVTEETVGKLSSVQPSVLQMLNIT